MLGDKLINQNQIRHFLSSSFNTSSPNKMLDSASETFERSLIYSLRIKRTRESFLVVRQSIALKSYR